MLVGGTGCDHVIHYNVIGLTLTAASTVIFAELFWNPGVSYPIKDICDQGFIINSTLVLNNYELLM